MAESEKNIIDAAIELFRHYGFEKTTMGDIAEKAKKGRRTIYTHFKNKEEIYNAILNKEIDGVVRQLQKVVGDDSDPAEKMENYFLKRMDIFKKKLKFYAPIKQSALHDYEIINNVRKSLDENEIRFISVILQEGVDRQIFNCTDIQLTAELILLALKGFEITYFIENNIPEKLLKEKLNYLCSLFFNGLLVVNEKTDN